MKEDDRSWGWVGGHGQIGKGSRGKEKTQEKAKRKTKEEEKEEKTEEQTKKGKAREKQEEEGGKGDRLQPKPESAPEKMGTNKTLTNTGGKRLSHKERGSGLLLPILLPNFSVQEMCVLFWGKLMSSSFFFFFFFFSILQGIRDNSQKGFYHK